MRSAGGGEEKLNASQRHAFDARYCSTPPSIAAVECCAHGAVANAWWLIAQALSRTLSATRRPLR